MQEQPNSSAFCRTLWAWPLCLLVAACGGGGGGGAGPGVLSQSPKCVAGTDALKIEGTVDGAARSDDRAANINAGYENIGTPNFNTPLSTLAPPAANQLTLKTEWSKGLF